MVHSYIYYDWLVSQLCQDMGGGSGYCVFLSLLPILTSYYTFSVDWPRSFVCTYQHMNPHRFTAPLSLSYTQSYSLTHLSSTHIPTVQSTLKLEGIILPHTERPLCIRNPWFTWLSPPRTALYCEMNDVTFRQCQGEGNVSVPPWWAFPHSSSHQLMTLVWERYLS